MLKENYILQTYQVVLVIDILFFFFLMYRSICNTMSLNEGAGILFDLLNDDLYSYSCVRLVPPLPPPPTLPAPIGPGLTRITVGALCGAAASHGQEWE